MATEIRNTSVDPLTLPSPLRGVLRGGQAIVLSSPRATLLALIPSLSPSFLVVDLGSSYPGLTDDEDFGPDPDASTARARVASTANLTLSAAQTIDGVAVVAGNVVLVKNQSTASQNGLYICRAGAWERSPLLPVGASAAGFQVLVEEGTANADISFLCTNNVGSDIVGTSNLVFASGAVVDALLVHRAGAETITGVKSFTEATSPIITAKLGPNAGQQHALPAATSDTIALLTAPQSLANKTLFGSSNNALGYDGATNNAPVEMFGAEVRGAAGAGAGAAGLAARVPFNAANSVGTVTRAGAIEGGWISPTNGSEQGYTALCGSYAGVAYPAVRATVPPAVAAYTNGLSVMGSITGSNPALSPFGGGANLGLDFMAVGDGAHRFYGATEFNVTDDGTPQNGTSLNMNVSHRLTVAPALQSWGSGQYFEIVDSLGVSSDLGFITANIADATPGAVVGSISLLPADGMNAAPGAGLRVAQLGAAAAAVRGVQIAPGATGINAVILGYGEYGAGLDLRADPLGSVGSIRLRNPTNSATVLGVEPTAAGVACITMQAAAPVRAATVTANAPAGIITFDTADATITVNNSCVGAQSFVLATVNTLDATMTFVRAVVTGAGQFTLNANAAATSNDVLVAFLVINPAA